MIKREIDIFFTALMFYTRIPCPSNINHSADLLNKATKYFPLIGWIVGALVAGVYWLAQFVFPTEIALMFSIASGIFITGAFHEDGFADVCDGFGGGYTKEARLNIMKDSRIGTYGSAGLVLILLLKFLILKELSFYNLITILIVGHTVSRFIPVLVIAFGEYARDDLTSKVKPIGRKISWIGFVIAFIFGLSSILLLGSFWFFLVVAAPLLIGLLMMRYFQKRIDGYTGDCLGAIQQVGEIAVYLSVYLIYNWI